MNDLLRITNLEKRYDNFHLTGVDLSVPIGSIVGFIGSNGAGKTTAIKSALGLVRPDDGSIELFGEDVTHAPSSHLARAKQRIGVVFDTCSFPEEMTVSTVGKLMGTCYRTWSAQAFHTFTHAFELPESTTVKELSRGMGMKLSLACALAHNPDLLILDEATAGLDPMAREDALDTLRLFMSHENRGILMSSHITSDLEKIADYLVCIDEGHIVFAREKDAITDMAGVAQCRVAEFDDVVASEFFTPGALRFERSAYGITLLVPDRQAFRTRFPNVIIERATIDQYMSLVLKGEAR